MLPNEIDVWQPLHVVSLAHTGLALGEMFDLDALSADSRTDGIGCGQVVFVEPHAGQFTADRGWGGVSVWD